MSFHLQTATTFVKLKLTNLGRRKMAQGKFSINDVVFSDREVNYAFNRRYPANNDFANMNPPSNQLYDQESNFIIKTANDAPGFPRKNYDGSDPYDVSDSVITTTEILTATTPSRGLWIPNTTGTSSAIGEYKLLDTSLTRPGIQKQAFSNNFDGVDFVQVSSSADTQVGDLAYFRFAVPTQEQVFAFNRTYPFYAQWYRVRDIQTSTFYLDRNTPNFSNFDAFGQNRSYVFVYPFSATTDYWNSGTTQPGPVWSYSVVRTSHVIGSTTTMAQNNSGYTSYGSKEFNGTKKYFGFDEDLHSIGFVWHEDNYTGSSYGDLFIPNTTWLDLPDLMWHRKQGIAPGSGMTNGHRFTDKNSDIYYDDVAKSSYTILSDGTDDNKIDVGRVYFDLKLIVLTHQELLVGISHKTNRNYTLPKLRVELREYHPDDGATAFIEEGKTYYFTYNMNAGTRFFWDPTKGPTSYGFQSALPCMEWTKVEGKNTPTGGKYYPSISLPPDGFPYLRAELNSFQTSGTGWLSNVFQIYVNELDTSKSGATGIDRVRPNKWSAATDALGGANTNGVYVGENASGFGNIDPKYMGTRMFNLKAQDFGFLNGAQDFEGNTPYHIISSGLTTWMGVDSFTGLTFGSDKILNGNVKTTIGVRTERVIATVTVDKNELNSSLNNGFDGSKDESAFISDIGVFDSDGELIASGKPTFPIKKNKSRHLVFQLEIDI